MTALGIDNPNSFYNREQRRLHVPALPLSRDAETRALEFTIQAVENLRAFRFTIGDIPGARLQAIRLGCLRAELRKTQRGM